MKYTIIDSATHSIVNAKSKKDLFKIIKESTPFFRNQTDKQFMDGYSIRRELLGLSKLNTESVDKFIDSMIANKLIVKDVITRAEAIKKFRAETEKFDKADEERWKKLPISKKKEYLKSGAERRAKRRAEGSLPKTYTEALERKSRTGSYLGGVKKKNR